MRQQIIPIEILERAKEIDRENMFWHTLEDIGFIVKRFCIGTMHHIKHEILPIRTSFTMDGKKMMIIETTTALARWCRSDSGEPVMTCENFIKWHIHLVREMTSEILLKLDNRKI